MLPRGDDEALLLLLGGFFLNDILRSEAKGPANTDNLS